MRRIEEVFMNFYNENATNVPFEARVLLVERKWRFAPPGAPLFHP